MNLVRSVGRVARASGESAIDWEAAADAARAATPPGSLGLTDAERAGYARDVGEARRAVRTVSGRSFAIPDTIEVQNRHHWIDANVATFERVFAPLERHPGVLPGLARTVNTGTVTVLLSVLGRHVLGQYDPLLLADRPATDHALYFVHPNIERTAAALDVDRDRFRRWIAFHEVTHAAEFGAAPWLSGYLERRLEAGVASLAGGSIDRSALRDIDATMSVVEGYAELLMDHAFDRAYADLRRKIDARRRGRGPLQRLLRRLLGLSLKRRQYERGRAFFEHVVAARDLEAAATVWDDPANLPTAAELEDPPGWLDRVDP